MWPRRASGSGELKVAPIAVGVAGGVCGLPVCVCRCLAGRGVVCAGSAGCPGRLLDRAGDDRVKAGVSAGAVPAGAGGDG